MYIKYINEYFKGKCNYRFKCYKRQIEVRIDKRINRQTDTCILTINQRSIPTRVVYIINNNDGM